MGDIPVQLPYRCQLYRRFPLRERLASAGADQPWASSTERTLSLEGSSIPHLRAPAQVSFVAAKFPVTAKASLAQCWERHGWGRYTAADKE